MWHKLLNIVSWLLIAAYLVVSLAFTNTVLDNKECVAVRAIVQDSNVNHFVNPAEIMTYVMGSGIKMHGVKMGELDQYGIRQAVLRMPGVREVIVYATPSGLLTIDVWQRTPLFRFVHSEDSYYVDEEGVEMPLSPNHSARVMIVTGEASRDFLRDSLKPIVEHINEKPFLESLIHGIHVEPDHTIELYCRIGDHRVFMGDGSEYQWKLAKLQTFYEKAMPIAGWQRYDKIDLRYSNQVVARKASSAKLKQVLSETNQTE